MFGQYCIALHYILTVFILLWCSPAVQKQQNVTPLHVHMSLFAK